MILILFFDKNIHTNIHCHTQMFAIAFFFSTVLKMFHDLGVIKDFSFPLSKKCMKEILFSVFYNTFLEKWADDLFCCISLIEHGIYVILSEK